MKLTEIIVCIAIFLLASVIFTASYINTTKVITKYETVSKSTFSVLSINTLLRNEIKKIYIPYWKNFNTEYENVEKRIRDFALEKNIEIINISPIENEKYNSEGIKVEWKWNGKEYVTQEYIKQRIIDAEY